MHPGPDEKLVVLADYRDRYGLKTMVETGLYLGRGSGMSLNFPRYIVIDHQQSNCDSAQADGFDTRCGDSGDLLPGVLAELDGPALIWLDAHGVDDDFPGFPDFPLFRELAAIAICAGPNSSDHVVLIDDIEMMKGGAESPLAGSSTLTELRTVVDNYGLWDREETDEIMRLTPR